MPCARARASPLRVQPPLAGDEGGEQARARLPGRRRRLERAVEREEREALLLRAREQAGEFAQRLRGRLALGNGQRLCLPARAQPRRLLAPGPLSLLARAAYLLQHIDELPAAAPAGGC